jgi:hypothetical protein
MHAMQEEESEDQQGPLTPRSGATAGVLESPNRIVIGPGQDQITVYANGVATAVLEKHTNSLELASQEPLFYGSVMDFENLYWTQTGALLRLQGETVMNILGPAVCVLRCTHRPVWHPRPGMDGLRLVVPRIDPGGLSTAEVFQLAIQLGF